MDLKTNGKAGVVTCDSRGVGLATVRALAAEGMQVLGAAQI